MARKRLGEILLERKAITSEQLMECLEEQKFTREYLGAILLKKRLISEDLLMKALSEQFDMPFVSLKNLYVDWSVCLQFSTLVASEQKALPILRDEMSVTVAISDPLDVVSIGKIEEMAWPKRLKLVLVLPEELREFVVECKRRTRNSLKDLLRGKDNA